MGKKIAFLVDTPLQLLNVLTYVIDNKLQHQADLFIVAQFKNADSIVTNVKQGSFFNNVYVLNKERKGLLKHIYTIMGLLMPDLYCKMLLGEGIRNKKYSAIYFSAPTKMFDFIIAASRAKHIYGVEDGIGSYSGDIFHDYLSKRYLFFRKILGNDYTVKKLYLRTPEYYCGPFSNMVCPLIMDRNISIFKDVYSVFNYKISNLYNHRIIYVNQPIIDFKQEHIQYEKAIINKITSKTKNKLLVRLHPRETFNDVYMDCEIDTEGNMWELLCAHCITNNSCIIGMFSTSQFVPKYFYNTEPLVVFTFRLYKDLDAMTVNRYEKQANQLRNLYTNTKNVVIINTVEEIDQIIQKLE